MWIIVAYFFPPTHIEKKFWIKKPLYLSSKNLNVCDEPPPPPPPQRLYYKIQVYEVQMSFFPQLFVLYCKSMRETKRNNPQFYILPIICFSWFRNCSTKFGGEFSPKGLYFCKLLIYYTKHVEGKETHILFPYSNHSNHFWNWCGWGGRGGGVL